MGFRLVPKSVNVNDLERHNGRVVCVLGSFGAPLRKSGWRYTGAFC